MTDTLLADGASEAVALTGGYHVAFFVGALRDRGSRARWSPLRQGAYAAAHDDGGDLHAAPEAA